MIMVDSSYFIGLIDQRDKWHKNAVNLKDYIGKEKKNVTDLIISEVLTVIGKRKGGKEGHILYQYFKDNCKILYPTEEDIDNAESIYLKYNGKLSLADSLTIHYMNKLSIQAIVSFDSDFDKVDNIMRVSE